MLSTHDKQIFANACHMLIKKIINIVITSKMQQKTEYVFLIFYSLKKMRCPILILHSKDDNLVPIKIAQGVLLAHRTLFHLSLCKPFLV